ncbi:MAG TPA: xanthine dehydrogenase family protein subunit M [Thermomicrobiaceae bacterium]|nr:xanthine dehydrogenase family protein subunit M [Thermomicrobiaceae bacterium]
MYPAAFDYYRAASVDEAIKLLGQHPDAKLLAGGHSLLPLMKLRLAEPPALIDLARVPGLSGIKSSGDRIVIGATTTYHEVLTSDVIKSSLPMLAEAAAIVGDLQVRNRGTIGGSLAHADPASDMPAVILALDGQVKVVGPNGERTIGASDFFVDLFTTALQPGEVLTEVSIARPAAGTGMAYEKFAHPASGYAVVGVAAVAARDGSTVRVAITGAGPVAKRASAVEQALHGKQLAADAVKAASAHATDGMDLNGDIFASEQYRAHLAQVLTERALNRAVGNARG